MALISEDLEAKNINRFNVSIVKEKVVNVHPVGLAPSTGCCFAGITEQPGDLANSWGYRNQ